MKKYFVVVFLFCAGCAITSPKTPQQLKTEHKAMVLGVTGNALENVIDPIGTKSILRFLELDGNKLEWSVRGGSQPTSLEIMPGEHHLTLICKGEMDRMNFEYIIPHYEISVEVGHIYQMQVQAYVGGCKVSHEDITDTLVK